MAMLHLAATLNELQSDAPTTQDHDNHTSRRETSYRHRSATTLFRSTGGIGTGALTAHTSNMGYAIV